MESAIALIDLVRLGASQLRRTPFEWAWITDLIQPRYLKLLYEQFPVSGFEEVSNCTPDKTYRMYCCTLLKAGTLQERALGGLSALWKKLYGEVSSREYCQAMERLTGRKLEDHCLEINLWIYERDCWLAPHCDKGGKSVSHIFYLAPDWRGHWGGHLRILRSPELSDYAEEVPPMAGNSVVLVRSAWSWHAVTSVQANPDWPRRSLQVVFWKPGEMK
jgi:SM-20-related protein